MTNMADVVAVLEPQDTLIGKSFCMTGHLGKPRHELQDLITKAGGRVQDRVTYDLDYLVTNEDWTASTVGKKGSSKYQKAKQYRVKIVNEETFFKMIGASPTDGG